MSNHQLEHAGYCATHRTVFTWRGKLQQQHACCPIAAGAGDKPCGLPLVRKPRGRSLGRHFVSTQQPIPRERLPLVVRPVQENATDGT